MASIAAGESSELEAMRKEDCSWHPCRVSLSSNNACSGIIVEFGSCCKDDIISDKKDALTRLRFRSTPLQDGECFLITEGECVLAMHKTPSRTLFFDAVVEKLNRVKHSNRVHCRCTFEIKWLNSEMEGQTITVPSKSIMKLSNKVINNNPVCAAFLNAMNPIGGEEVPSFLSLYEETNCEADLHGILEKQIEEISRLADGSKEVSFDLSKDERDNLSWLKQNKAVVTSQTNTKNSQNNFRRSTRSQSKQQLNVDVELEKEEDKPFLSPLAARAALASLVHELPLTVDFSAFCEDKEDHVGILEKDPKKFIPVHSLNVTCKRTRSETTSEKNVLVVLDPTQTTDNKTSVDSRYGSRTSISRHGVIRKKSRPCKSREQIKSSQVSEELETTKVNSPTGSATDQKSSGPAITRRLTRSAVQKQMPVSSDKVKHGFLSEELMGSVNAMKLTQPVQLKVDNSSDSKQELGENQLNQIIQDVAEDFVTPDVKESKKKRLISSPLDPDTESALERRRRTRASTAAEIAEEGLGNVSRDGKSSEGAKKKAVSSKKPEHRFSQRLRFLPRTRSQRTTSPAC